MEREFNLCCGAEQSSAETTPGSTWGCLGVFERGPKGAAAPGEGQWGWGISVGPTLLLLPEPGPVVAGQGW